MSEELTLDEAWDVLELMMNERYDATGVDFMMAMDTDTTEQSFPGSHDLTVLAEPLRDWGFDQDEPV